MTDAETIAQIKSNALAKIVEIQGRPDYAADGQQFQFQNMVAELKRTVAWCDEQLEGDDPVEAISQMDTY